MTIRASVNLTSLKEAMAQQERELTRAVTAGMKDGAGALKTALRDQVVAAGLGDRLAKTWRDRTYPEKKASLHPKGWVWSKAPEIISAYDEGREIVPVNGRKYLAIPTRAARALTGKKGARLTVAQVEARLKRPIVIIRSKNGNLLGLYDPRTSASKRRGTKRDLILLYTFVPMVKVRKRLDVAREVERIAGKLPDLIGERLS